MPALTNPEVIPRKPLTFFFVVENSAAMNGSKLATINTALENFTALLQYYAAIKTGAGIKIALLTFGEHTRWLTPNPVDAGRFVWEPIPEGAGNHGACFNAVFAELNSKLSKKTFLASPVGELPPVILLFATSPGSPDTGAHLCLLAKNNWDKNALKLAFAIGKTADKSLLEKWTGCEGLTLSVKNPQMLLEMASISTRLCVQIAMNAVSGGSHQQFPVHGRRLALKESLESMFAPAAPVARMQPVTSGASVQPVTPEASVQPVTPEARMQPVTSGAVKAPQAAEMAVVSKIAVAYKAAISKQFVSISPAHIDDRVGGSRFFVTRKYDGELAVLLWDGHTLAAVNSRGKPYRELRCVREAALQLTKRGITRLCWAAELYRDESGGRSRVSDCASALAGDGSSLRLAPFDIIGGDGTNAANSNYNAIHAELQAIFADNAYCAPVRYREAGSRAAIKKIFAEWVESEGSEGLVVRSAELPLVYKIKPRITVDAAVVGFSECSDIRGQVRTLLYALRDENGRYEVIGRTGNGLTAEQKTALFTRLMRRKTASNYIEIDSNRLAFHIVKPELVIELSIGDVITENTSGCIRNPVLECDGGMVKQTGSRPGCSFITAVIERLREDKTVEARDVSIAQLSGRLTPVESGGRDGSADDMPKSRLLIRDVWTKGEAVQKLVVWKTNKERFNFPAYAASWTLFNPGLAEPFKVDMRVSSSEQQILQLAGQFKAKNIKSNWIKM